MRFVDITNDIAFRKIFGNDSKKKTLISFLNAIITLPDNEVVTDVEITNPYQLGKLSGGKSTIVDVKAKDSKGNVYIVEMQIAEFAFFKKRILYYTSQSYVAQLDKGIGYEKLEPVYFIGILEFEIGNNPSYFSKHKVLDVETKEQVIQDVEFNFIELPKFNKTIDQLETSIDQWAFFIKNAGHLKMMPDSVNDEGLKEAYIEAEEHNWTKLELEDYIRANLKVQDDIGKFNFALRKAEKNAEEKGELKGIIVGKKEGKKEGIIEGKIEGKIEVAKSLRQNGVSIDIIAVTTGFTKEEIEKL